jgi:hypothetical protein
MKKTETKKSRATVPLRCFIRGSVLYKVFYPWFSVVQGVLSVVQCCTRCFIRGSVLHMFKVFYLWFSVTRVYGVLSVVQC